MVSTPNQSHTDSDFLTVAEFCDCLGIKQATGRKWVFERRVSIVKVGSRLVRIPRSELDRVVKEGFRAARTGEGRGGEG